MEVYADPITVNCRKVLAGLQLLGVDYNLSKVDYFQGEQKGAPYVAINPNAALPALRDDGLTLWESNAILQYAADKHSKAAFYPHRPESPGRRQPVAVLGMRRLVSQLLHVPRRELRQATARRGRRSGDP